MSSEVAGSGHRALADRLACAMTSGDPVAYGALWAPESTLWHNVDGKLLSKDDNVRNFEHARGSFKSFRMQDVRTTVTDSGFVQQFVVIAQSHDGKSMEIPVCLVATVKHDMLIRAEEYFHSPASLYASAATSR